MIKNLDDVHLLTEMAGPSFAAAVEAYEKGEWTSALSLFRQLAEDGDPEAQFNLGVMLQKGLGSPPDAAEAGYWMARAENRGQAIPGQAIPGGAATRDGMN